MTIHGSCLCKAVTYEIAGDFQVIGNCHCGICRKANGAAYVTWGIADPTHFKWVKGENNLAIFESSPGRQRIFCKTCGASLASAHEGVVGEVVLGSVDGDPGGKPAEHIFVGSKAEWHDITDALPQHAAWPPGMEA